MAGLDKGQTSRELPSGEKNDPLFVDALARGFKVLEAFAESPEPMSLAELATISGLSKSGTQRVVHTLIELGYLARTDKGIVPGIKVLERTFDYLRATPIVHRAVPILADLRRTVQERVDLSLFDDLSMMYVVRMQSKRDTFYAHLLGRRVPTFCSSGGRAVLSLLPRAQTEDLIARSDIRKYTARTTTVVKDILAKVDEARERGYAVSLEEMAVGEITVGAAVRNQKGTPIAAIHVSASLGEWNPKDFVNRVGPLVSAASIGLSSG